MFHEATLSSLRQGQAAKVAVLKAQGSMRRRFQDLGIIEGTAVECLGAGPLGDPCAYLIRGAVIALRQCDASTIVIGPAYAAGVLASPVSPLPAAE